MCNIAGYVGTKTAAPILIEMMKRQEGWDGGYYTGIATVSHGKLFTDKVVGDIDRFLKLTKAADFPGTVGILHSRSKAGGDVRWAHPFVGATGKLAYVANGTGGAYAKAGLELLDRTYMTLKDAGYPCSSATKEQVRRNRMQADGCCAHVSDIMCQMTAQMVDSGMTTADAMGEVYRMVPREVVSLAVNTEEPDRISFARVNYPMFLGFADHGTYLATTPMAFPEDTRRITLLDAVSCGSVYADRYETKPISDFTGTVAPITPQVWHRCYEAVVNALAEKEMSHDELDLLVKPLFDPATCVEEAATEYAILYELQKQGRLEITKRRVPGVYDDMDAPKLFVKLK